MIHHSVPSSLILSAKLACLAVATSLLAGCAGMGGGSGGNYGNTAYAPLNPNDVKVKVSLHAQNVYVEEGDRLLLGTPTCVGKPGYPTPTGQFEVIGKQKDKRSSEYGYWTNGNETRPGTSSQPTVAGGHYVGYPMAFWVEFTPGFGFHEGPIWPYGRSHGCLHLHEGDVLKFWKLVHIGTPVEVAYSLPEDSKYHIDRPTDYADPDPAPSMMISSEWFDKSRPDTLTPLPASGAAQ